MDDDIVSGITKYQNGPGIDNKLRQTNASATTYFVADHLGSTNGLTNSSGALTASNAYDSFGNPTNSTFPGRYQFTGREFDSTTGQQYSRARFYDPKIGRFISEDPIGFAGGDENLYGYVLNNPISFTDPTGYFPSWWRFNYHADITRHGLKGFASPEQIEAIANANTSYDRRTQVPIYAPYHAMTRPGQTPAEALAEANDFVRRKICEARRLAELGDEAGAMNELGQAIHTLQDSHSPAHSGFQEAWPTDLGSTIENIPHSLSETLLPGRANLNAAEDSTRRAWRYFKGDPMPSNFFPN